MDFDQLMHEAFTCQSGEMKIRLLEEAVRIAEFEHDQSRLFRARREYAKVLHMEAKMEQSLVEYVRALNQLDGDPDLREQEEERFLWQFMVWIYGVVDDPNISIRFSTT
ncbi:MAG: hypothetical protein CMJ78_25915 [Planctomycetaceae bacterium]|nr:hypothetical protein [Planctomycetaceae bacterium]